MFTVEKSQHGSAKLRGIGRDGQPSYDVDCRDGHGQETLSALVTVATTIATQPATANLPAGGFCNVGPF